MGAFDSIDPVGALGRTNETPNIDAQPDDHNEFGATLDALRSAGASVEADLAAFEGSAAASVASLTAAVASKVTTSPATDSIAEAFAGMRVVARSMRRVVNGAKRVKRVVVVGDSQSQGNTPGPSAGTCWTLGGPGAWPELLSIGLQGLLGPCLSRGFRGLWSGEWSVIGTWTAPTTANTWDRAPWGQALQHAAGGPGTDYATWTKPTIPGPLNTVAAFELFWIDFGGSSAPSLSIDGGGWQAWPQARAQDGLLKSFLVVPPLGVSSTVRVRPATTGGTFCPVTVVGIRPWTVDPRSAAWGFVLDNLGFSAKTLYEFTRAGSLGDPWAILDAVVTNEATQVGAADLAIVGFSNDAVSSIPGVGGNVDLFTSELRALHTRLDGSGADLALWAPYERAFADQSAQATFRQAVHDVAAERGLSSLDFYEAWAVGLGGAGWTRANAAGLMDPPTSGYAHAGPKGHADQASRFRRLISLAA